jgi:shikimate kinase
MVILCGFHKCGKSSVGRYLSNRVGCPIFDTDRLMEAMNGFGSVRELHERVGESRFRELEAAAIRSLPIDRRMVVATGGGALLDPRNIVELNRRGLLCFLDVSWVTLKERCSKLPSYAKSWEELERIYSQRRALYRSQVAWRIEVTNESVEEVGQLILEQHGK